MDTIAQVIKCSKFELTISITSESASEVGTFFRNPYCESLIILKLFKNFKILTFINFSNKVENLGHHEMGLYFSVFNLPPYLNNGITFAFVKRLEIFLQIKIY